MRKHIALFLDRSLADKITLLGAIPFLLSLYFITKNEPELALLASVGMFFIDSIDGVIARKLNQNTDFGRQLDSAMDALYYLVFPALFIIKFLNPYLLLTLSIGSLIISLGILRLIRFNIRGFVYRNGQRCYPGLGTAYILPAVAVLFISQHWIGVTSLWLTPLVMLVMSLAMISDIPIKKPSLKFWYPTAIIISLLLISLYFQWI